MKEEYEYVKKISYILVDSKNKALNRFKKYKKERKTSYKGSAIHISENFLLWLN